MRKCQDVEIEVEQQKHRRSIGMKDIDKAMYTGAALIFWMQLCIGVLEPWYWEFLAFVPVWVGVNMTYMEKLRKNNE